jgi:hypothetical protein
LNAEPAKLAEIEREINSAEVLLFFIVSSEPRNLLDRHDYDLLIS